MSKNPNRAIVIPIYRWTVYVAVGEAQLSALSESKGFDIDLSVIEGNAACCIPMEYYRGRLAGVQVNILYFSPGSTDAGTIVHECIHSVHNMMASRGIPIDMSNTEVMSYTTEYLFNAVVKKIISAASD